MGIRSSAVAGTINRSVNVLCSLKVHKLLRTGEHAFKTRSFQHALHCYDEALEIDEMSVESYAGKKLNYYAT